MNQIEQQTNSLENLYRDVLKQLGLDEKEENGQNEDDFSEKPVIAKMETVNRRGEIQRSCHEVPRECALGQVIDMTRN